LALLGCSGWPTPSVSIQTLHIRGGNIFNHFNVPAVKNTEWNVVAGQLVLNNSGANAFGIPTAPGGGSNYPFAAPVNLNGARIFQAGAKISF